MFFFSNTDVKECIIRLMQQCRINLVDVPQHIIDILQHENCDIQTLTSDFIARCLKSNPVYISCSYDDKMAIFTYLASDGNLSRFSELELLPINNGAFVKFGDRKECSPVLVCEKEMDLFLGHEDIFLRKNLPAHIYSSIYLMAKTGKCNVLN